MRSSKPFTNEYYTKRVDHDGGRHREARAEREPAECEHCGALLINRRWTRRPGASSMAATERWRPPHMVLCPACRQEVAGLPRGFVTITGTFTEEHLDEIRRLLRNEALRAADDNPMARITHWEYDPVKGLSVATTTEHLAQRLGHALEKAYGGEVHYGFSHENKFTRVDWWRDSA